MKKWNPALTADYCQVFFAIQSELVEEEIGVYDKCGLEEEHLYPVSNISAEANMEDTTDTLAKEQRSQLQVVIDVLPSAVTTTPGKTDSRSSGHP